MHGILIQNPLHTMVRADTRSILAFHIDRQEQLYNCIGCGRCIEACPSGLNPHKLYRCVTTNHAQKAISLGLAQLHRMFHLQLCLPFPPGPCLHHHQGKTKVPKR